MNATLHTGTKYLVEDENGTEVEKTLEADTEVEVLELAEHWHLYRLGDKVICVRPQDDR